MGGALAQLVGAETGCKTVTFNAPGVAHLLKDKSKKPESYTNITNYSVENDALNITNILGSYKQIGQTRIIPSSGKNSIDAHGDFDALGNSDSIPYRDWERQNMQTIAALKWVAGLSPYTRAIVFNNILSSGIYKFYDIKKMIESRKDNRNSDKVKNTPTSSAAYNNLSNNRITDPFLQGFYGEPKDTRTSSQRVADRIDNDELDDDIAFLDGFNYDQPDRYLISEANKRRKERARQTGSKGKGPHGEDGYWYTTKQGKHVFVPDDKTA